MQLLISSKNQLINTLSCTKYKLVTFLLSLISVWEDECEIRSKKGLKSNQNYYKRFHEFHNSPKFWFWS